MIMQYVRNCFWLIVPILAMNLLLMGKLPKIYQPEVFSSHIPAWIIAGENVLRLATLVLPFFMPLDLSSQSQKIGLVIYFVGLILYFISWAMQLWYPQIAWSTSRWGFMAPSYTPII